MNDYLVDFAAPPPIGTRITTRTRDYRLEEVRPHRRKRDGVATFILHWLDGKGDRYTSGLRSRGMTKQSR